MTQTPKPLAGTGRLVLVHTIAYVCLPGRRLCSDALQDSYGFDIEEGDSLEVQHQKVEKLLREEVKAEAEWQPNGSLHVVQRVPAIRKIKSSGRYSFFNTLSGVYGVAKRLGALEYPYKEKNGPGYKLPSSFGDGSPIPEKYLERIIEIQDSIGFLVPWQEGDIAVVNNYTVQVSFSYSILSIVFTANIWRLSILGQSLLARDPFSSACGTTLTILIGRRSLLDIMGFMMFCCCKRRAGVLVSWFCWEKAYLDATLLPCGL